MPPARPSSPTARAGLPTMSAAATPATATPATACRTNIRCFSCLRISLPFVTRVPRWPEPDDNRPGRARQGAGASRAVARSSSRRRAQAVAAAAACFFIHSVVTLLGRSIGVPIARLMMSWEAMPIARETENSTV